jgi:hypothetical protein
VQDPGVHALTLPTATKLFLEANGEALKADPDKGHDGPGGGAVDRAANL